MAPVQQQCLLCSGCGANQPRSEYSKRQWKAASDVRKCKECVEAHEAAKHEEAIQNQHNNRVRCENCCENLSRTCFSKTQLGQAVGKRTCRSCVAAKPNMKSGDATLSSPSKTPALVTSSRQPVSDNNATADVEEDSTTRDVQQGDSGLSVPRTDLNEHPQTKTDGVIETTSLQCSKCLSLIDRSVYSKSQRKKGDARKCPKCVNDVSSASANESQANSQTLKEHNKMDSSNLHQNDSDDATLDSHDLNHQKPGYDILHDGKSSDAMNNQKLSTIEASRAGGGPSVRQDSPVSIMQVPGESTELQQIGQCSQQNEINANNSDTVSEEIKRAKIAELTTFLEKFYKLHMHERLENRAKFVEKRAISYWYRAEKLRAILQRKLNTRKSDMKAKLKEMFRRFLPDELEQESNPGAYIDKLVEKWHGNPDTAYQKIMDIAAARNAQKKSAIEDVATSATNKKLNKIAAAEKALKKKQTCDRCDGNHEESKCPYYRKSRDKHPDAQRGKSSGLGSSGGNYFLPSARIIQQPGDGNCLFHSLRNGLNYRGSTSQLRKELARWVKSNQNVKIADSPLKMWVKWDSGTSVESYTSRMSYSGWGGGIEMAACSHRFNVNVHVYESTRGGFKRISCFDVAAGGTKTVHVLYRGGVHYDALVPTSKGIVPKWAVKSGGAKFGKKRQRSSSIGSDWSGVENVSVTKFQALNKKRSRQSNHKVGFRRGKMKRMRRW